MKPIRTANQFDSGITRWMGKNGITLLRITLAITYLWFGGLKLVGKSPLNEVVKDSTPIIPRELAVPVTGVMEVLIGLGLLTRVAMRGTLALFFIQILGTFFVLIRTPQRAFQNGNPLLLTETGQFVIKNLVMLSAGLVVGSTLRSNSEDTAQQ